MSVLWDKGHISMNDLRSNCDGIAKRLESLGNVGVHGPFNSFKGAPTRTFLLQHSSSIHGVISW